MNLFFIIYEAALNGELTSVLDKVKVERYIKWDNVKGKWKKNIGVLISGPESTILF
jgi:hypothetical protein